MADEPGWVSLTIDGVEVRARAGELLLEAAKDGDVEIPYFCYERKLGPPVGACRMCMVEIEGMPKLQVSCATPVKDGMVVYTQTDRVKHAQSAIVEFLLVNHPLDCPVCDKGGECPLQDIAYGWGPGRSRFVEAKRNFPKPIALSPLVAIDRERCILCYRCVRFSQEVAEDHQLVFLERADHTFVGTFDGRPYVAPFAGNIIELCPVGALTSNAYRFRARPWDVENSASVCMLCPSQCNVTLTVRDDRVERVIARENEHVDDGWLCDKGRFGYQAIHSPERITEPLVRDGGRLRPVSWERALDAAIEGLRKAGAATAALAAGGATNEEGYLLQRLFREGLGSGNVDSRAGGRLDPSLARLLSQPEITAKASDVDGADVVLVIGTDPMQEMPILDLRIRKAVRRLGARLIVAATHPTTLDGGASERLRFQPGGEEALLRALQKAIVTAGRRPAEGEAEDLLRFLEERSLDDFCASAGADRDDVDDAAGLLAGAAKVVVLWGERIGRGDRGTQTLEALADLALLVAGNGGEGSGLIEVPAVANARGLREVGLVAGLGPGLADAEVGGLAASEMPGAAERGEVRAFYLLESDPLREQPDGAAWGRALNGSTVIAHSQFMNESIEHHADVVFPAESYAEKDGTSTHPDGRVQRLRPAIGRPPAVRSGWKVLAEIAGRLGLLDAPYAWTGVLLAEMAQRVAPYRGLTIDEIGAKGVRWPEREASLEATRELLGEPRFSSPSEPPPAPAPTDGSLRLGTVPDLWASWETERSPALDFLKPGQELHLHPSDAERLGLLPDEDVEVASNGHSVRAALRLRQGARPGTAHLVRGTAEDNSNLLDTGDPLFVHVQRVEARQEKDR